MVALFVLVKPLFYTGSCLTSIFYIAGVLLIQQDNHMGSALFAAAIACGHLSAGIVFAGLMVRAHAYTQAKPGVLWQMTNRRANSLWLCFWSPPRTGQACLNTGASPLGCSHLYLRDRAVISTPHCFKRDCATAEGHGASLTTLPAISLRRTLSLWRTSSELLCDVACRHHHTLVPPPLSRADIWSSNMS